MAGNITNIETVLNRGFDNIYISTAIKVFIALYAALAAPRLPPTLIGLFDNTLFRIVIAFAIIFMAVRDPSIAIMLAVAFIITLQTANKFRLFNSSLSVAPAGETSWLPSAKHVVQPPQVHQPHQPQVEQVVPETAFTSPSQFIDAESNQVPGADQQSCVQTWNNEICIQGLETNQPSGLDAEDRFSTF